VEVSEDGAELAELALVGRGEQEAVQRSFSAFF